MKKFMSIFVYIKNELTNKFQNLPNSRLQLENKILLLPFIDF